MLDVNSCLLFNETLERLDVATHHILSHTGHLMTRSSSRLLFVAVAFVGLSSLACSGNKGAAERMRIIHDRTANHSYNKPCDQVLPEARAHLFTLGYSVKNTGEGSTTVESEWKREVNMTSSTARNRNRNTSMNRTTNNNTQSQSRYLIQGIEKDATCTIRANHNSPEGSGRDLDFEWGVLKLADPEAANKISQEAEVAAQAAANS